MNTITTAILSACGGAIFTFILANLKKVRARGKVFKSLAHNALFYECKRLIDKGSMTTDELENLNYLWEGYHGMGLNGSGECLYNRCKELPLEDKNE